jgi:hypothetical protein
MQRYREERRSKRSTVGWLHSGSWHRETGKWYKVPLHSPSVISLRASRFWLQVNLGRHGHPVIAEDRRPVEQADPWSRLLGTSAQPGGYWGTAAAVAALEPGGRLDATDMCLSGCLVSRYLGKLAEEAKVREAALRLMSRLAFRGRATACWVRGWAIMSITTSARANRNVHLSSRRPSLYLHLSSLCHPVRRDAFM